MMSKKIAALVVLVTAASLLVAGCTTNNVASNNSNASFPSFQEQFSASVNASGGHITRWTVTPIDDTTTRYQFATTNATQSAEYDLTMKFFNVYGGTDATIKGSAANYESQINVGYQLAPRPWVTGQQLWYKIDSVTPYGTTEHIVSLDDSAAHCIYGTVVYSAPS